MEIVGYYIKELLIFYQPFLWYADDIRPSQCQHLKKITRKKISILEYSCLYGIVKVTILPIKSLIIYIL